ncbi:lysophospholipid acyltransferase family protein [Glycomyces xiaoerkulensis]|uniref:lysophospholipid acyltransferase family protein n=1 Tax=Glycomyces xiaoerkulensis TaxID=2038139 RepID=UPI0018E4CA04|nr:lysophospholipid acyltransferase family protein [Glycomyces xiaoerkulensis]
MTEETVDAKYTFCRSGGDRLGWVRIPGAIVKFFLLLLTKREWRGMRHVPLQGPAIFVWNHYSDFDPLPVCHYVYNAGRHPRFLLKHSLIRIPVAGPIIHATGQIPVYRGRRDAADSLREAIAVLENGGSVIIAPEGSVTKEPDRWPMRGKTGVARLALETGAPVVPIAQWGSLQIHDRHRKPKFRIGRRKLVTVAARPPVDLDRWREAEINRDNLVAVSDHIMNALRDGVAELRGREAPPLFDLRSRQQPREESEPTD